MRLAEKELLQVSSVPKQSECDAYYGNPRGRNGMASPAWEKANLVRITFPYPMYYDGKPVSSTRFHKKAAPNLLRALNKIKLAADFAAKGNPNLTRKILRQWGADQFGGAYNYRLMRNGSSLSRHSWGIAIDLDPARNGMGDNTPYFANVPQVVAAFKSEGFAWGGDWKYKDAMHFELLQEG